MVSDEARNNTIVIALIITFAAVTVGGLWLFSNYMGNVARHSEQVVSDAAFNVTKSAEKTENATTQLVELKRQEVSMLASGMSNLTQAQNDATNETTKLINIVNTSIARFENHTHSPQYVGDPGNSSTAAG
jgi:hypothetical protein